MTRIHNTTIIGTSFLVVSLVIAPRWIYVHQPVMQKRHIQEELTRREITQRAEQLLTQLTPARPFQFIEAERVEMSDRLRRPMHIWVAQCSRDRGADGTSAPYAFLRWNADTGRLMSFSRERGSIKIPGVTISALEAERFAIHWLGLLDSGWNHQPWHSTGRFEKNQLAWLMYFTAGSDHAMVAVNVDDGNLQCARIW